MTPKTFKRTLQTGLGEMSGGGGGREGVGERAESRVGGDGVWGWEEVSQGVGGGFPLTIPH